MLLKTISFGQSSKVDSLINLLTTTKDDTLKVTILNRLFLEFEYTDDVKAFDYLNKSLELCKKSNYQKGLFTTYTNFAYYYEDKSNFHQALTNYTFALKAAEKLSNSIGIGASYNSIGVVYYYLGNYQEALKIYEDGFLFNLIKILTIMVFLIICVCTL